jgi:glyoxylase-like metal-dependent hydrolase (beta-lactamase superfamily II)
MSDAAAGPLDLLGPGIARVRLPSPTLPPATTTNVWVLGSGPRVLVDPGSPWEAGLRSLVERVAELGVVASFLTHHHQDHASGAAWLRDHAGLEIWSHPTTGDRTGLRLDRTVQDGDVLELGSDRWQALLTPGHADGHLCLHRSDGEVVAGDMVAGEGTILLAPPDADLAAYLESLAALQRLSPRRLLPAHGPPLAPAGPVLDHYIHHRHARTDQVRQALARGPLSAVELAPMVYPELPASVLTVAAIQLQAHLDWLVQQGEVVPDDHGRHRLLSGPT